MCLPIWAQFKLKGGKKDETDHSEDHCGHAVAGGLRFNPGAGRQYAGSALLSESLQHQLGGQYEKDYSQGHCGHADAGGLWLNPDAGWKFASSSLLSRPMSVRKVTC